MLEWPAGSGPGTASPPQPLVDRHLQDGLPAKLQEERDSGTPVGGDVGPEKSLGRSLCCLAWSGVAGFLDLGDGMERVGGVLCGKDRSSLGPESIGCRWCEARGRTTSIFAGQGLEGGLAHSGRADSQAGTEGLGLDRGLVLGRTVCWWQTW